METNATYLPSSLSDAEITGLVELPFAGWSSEPILEVRDTWLRNVNAG